MKQPLEIELTIEKLVFGGQGLAHYDGMPVFVWNALPGERVTAEVVKKRGKKNWMAIATEIHEAASYRQEPIVPQYLSTSPWQIMPFDKENEFKQQIARETYERIGGLTIPDEIPIYADEQRQFGYRNKIEFSFFEFDDDDDRGNGVSLAFFQRGKHYKMPIESSALAEPVINDIAISVLAWVNENGLTRRDLKTLIVRSNGKGQAVAALFLKNDTQYEHYPELSDQLLGLQVYYSTPKSPASVPTELLYSAGQDYLTATLLDTELQFGLLGFFQVNIPIFEKALEDLVQHVKADQPLLDLYSGVGAIGLPLATHASKVQLVDNNEEAIQFAQRNIKANEIAKSTAQCVPAEQVTELITGEETVIVDPPRAGLHAKVVDRLLEQLPETVIYLSCNLSTQARDIKLLESAYMLSSVNLYNFFPRTPHIEALCVLKRS